MERKHLTLSLTETQYTPLSEVAHTILLAKQVFETIGGGLKLPIKVKIDNVGEIYLTKNHLLGHRTKHIDIRW
jgi:hypothetical protein